MFNARKFLTISILWCLRVDVHGKENSGLLEKVRCLNITHSLNDLIFQVSYATLMLIFIYALICINMFDFQISRVGIARN